MSRETHAETFVINGSSLIHEAKGERERERNEAGDVSSAMNI